MGGLALAHQISSGATLRRRLPLSPRDVHLVAGDKRPASRGKEKLHSAAAIAKRHGGICRARPSALGCAPQGRPRRPRPRAGGPPPHPVVSSDPQRDAIAPRANQSRTPAAGDCSPSKPMPRRVGAGWSRATRSGRRARPQFAPCRPNRSSANGHRPSAPWRTGVRFCAKP